MFKRLLKLPLEGKFSIFLFGPRGTGKTFWLKQHLKDALYFDLLHKKTYDRFSENPDLLEQSIPIDFSNWVIIDEIQKLPYLLNEVHRLIESKRIRFILTGSSARSLRRKGINLLAGRAIIYHMHPLIVQEIGKKFDLAQALKFGLLPSVIGDTDAKRYLSAYIKTYIEQEVMAEGLARNQQIFSKFLSDASFSQGQPVNITKIASKVGVDRMTITNYFDILEDLLIGVRLEPFTERAKREMLQRQKFYFFDTGVYRFLRPQSIGDIDEEIDGPALETLFLQSLRAVNDYYDLDYKIYYWHTQSDLEVDFVIFGPKGFHAFEIKRASQIRPRDIQHLKLFMGDYPEATAHMLYMGAHKEYRGDIIIRPFEEALRELPQLIGAT